MRSGTELSQLLRIFLPTLTPTIYAFFFFFFFTFVGYKVVTILV